MNDNHTFYDYTFLGCMIGAALVVMIMVALGVWKENKSHGYGGSPGHMTPNEVDEMWQKNQK